MRNWRAAIAIASFAWAGVSLAAPVIIHDTGRGLSLAPYFEPLQDANADAAAPVKPVPDSVADGLLPVHTPEMSPGKVVTRPLNKPELTQPLFLIGPDALSLEWLRRHRERLIQINAIGMLVEARTSADLQAVAGLAKGLRIMPASASDIARLLGLTHYPVLITRTGIEQ
ncbi:MAG: integrating conjugative element protein [Gammaproteobacteria bacterium]|nr:integrating conjugative element protein [Gammaproteobacteria bacterium]